MTITTTRPVLYRTADARRLAGLTNRQLVHLRSACPMFAGHANGSGCPDLWTAHEVNLLAVAGRCRAGRLDSTEVAWVLAALAPYPSGSWAPQVKVTLGPSTSMLISLHDLPCRNTNPALRHRPDG
jgi:hypothetical protein